MFVALDCLRDLATWWSIRIRAIISILGDEFMSCQKVGAECVMEATASIECCTTEI